MFKQTLRVVKLYSNYLVCIFELTYQLCSLTCQYHALSAPSNNRDNKMPRIKIITPDTTFPIPALEYPGPKSHCGTRLMDLMYSTDIVPDSRSRSNLEKINY